MKDEIKEISQNSDFFHHFLHIFPEKSQLKNDLLDYITTLQKENDRLNNIINELENYIEDKRNYYCETDNEYWSINQILQELKKLKENK